MSQQLNYKAKSTAVLEIAALLRFIDPSLLCISG